MVPADTIVERGYLNEQEGGYLETPYLGGEVDHHISMQVNMVIVDHEHAVSMQVSCIIRELHVGMQVYAITKDTVGMQATLVFYNTTQIRIMTSFPSRGTAALVGNNWTSSSQYTGDYAAKNLNTDIVEQVYRSAAATSALVELICDTGLTQGVPIDTIAILGHNLTTSAQVQVQGSTDNFASPPVITFNLSVEKENMYYIAPSLPTQTGQNRYWKFVIQDPTNPSGYVQIGTILFGASKMFSISESFEQPLVRGFKHFKDTVPNEGFTTVSNDRALKRFLKLRFAQMDYSKGNFKIIDDMMQLTRTSLKTLVIPTPEYPSRFAIYGKLVQMPELTHVDNGDNESLIDFELEWDESL